MSGLLWTLILRFTISGIQVDGVSAKEGLLLWCQRKTQGYAGVDVYNFTSSWTDGLAFCALLNKYRSDVLDYSKLDRNDHRGNTALAFRVAERHVDIPALLSVDDVCDVVRPDERSVMTYVAQFYHAFSHLDKVGNAGRRIEKFADAMQSVTTMQHDFERRMKALYLSIDAIQSAWRASYFIGTYDDAKRQAIAFSEFKKTKKRSWVREKAALEALLGNIQTKLQSYQLCPYAPPSDFVLHRLEARWDRLLVAEAKQAQSINSKIREVKEALRTSFASKINDFAHMLNVLSTHLVGLSGELEAQLQSVANLAEHLEPLQVVLSEISTLADECERANVEENDHTIYTFEDIEYQFRLVKESVLKKQKFIETQILARSKSNVTAGQLEEIDAIFQHFDRNCTDALLQEDFGAALASLGFMYEPAELEELFAELSAKSRQLKMQRQVQRGLGSTQQSSRPVSLAHRRTGSTMTRSGSTSPTKRHSQYDPLAGTISYDVFLDFMLEELEDQNSPEQVLSAFKDVAGGQQLVTEADLRRSQIGETAVQFLVSVMPRGVSEVDDRLTEADSDGLDYLAYMSTLLFDRRKQQDGDRGGGSSSGRDSIRSDVEIDQAQNLMSHMSVASPSPSPLLPPATKTQAQVVGSGRQPLANAVNGNVSQTGDKENRPRSFMGRF